MTDSASPAALTGSMCAVSLRSVRRVPRSAPLLFPPPVRTNNLFSRCIFLSPPCPSVAVGLSWGALRLLGLRRSFGLRARSGSANRRGRYAPFVPCSTAMRLPSLSPKTHGALPLSLRSAERYIFIFYPPNGGGRFPARSSLPLPPSASFVGGVVPPRPAGRGFPPARPLFGVSLC